MQQRFTPVLQGVYSHSLAEFTLFACNYFAKDLPRLLAAKADKK
jgi:hypothetical protein